MSAGAEPDPAASAQGMDPFELRLAREHALRLEAERLLETKSLELLEVNRNLAQLNQELERRVARRTDELERERLRALRLAEHDTLTGLPNRARFLTHLDRSLQDAARGGHHVALLVFDIDRFKQFNDTFGHSCGDSLLIAVARRVERGLKGGDLLARLGSDEFAVVTVLADLAGAEALAVRILELFNAPFEIDGRILHVSVTIGVAFAPEHAATAPDLQRFADLGLYAGKIAGRKRISVFSNAIRQEFETRWLMEERLRAAIDSQAIGVCYQPILNLRTGRIAGVEALARWQHPIMGAVPPDQFIQVAEENQLIRELGRQVLARACAETRPWLREGGIEFFSVNLSPIQMQDGHAVSSVIAALDDLSVDPRSLVLEVTERLMLLDSPEVRRSLDALRNRGVCLALDDFGAGFSNLSYLSRFPIDRIKIDRSLVMGIETENFSRIIVQSVTDLAHRLGLQVIVEGVETVEQRDILSRIGCDYAQGYWFSHPLPAAEFERLLADSELSTA
jgi:diguanylate cyclase (GGDEF)-like protein